MTRATDTIAAIATPAGRGGIGVIRVSGAGVPAIIEGIVARMPAPRAATLAIFRDARGAPLDQGIVLYFPAPGSYTGEAVVEFQGHGGPAVLRALLARCMELGARLARPGEFTERAFLNDKLDLAQAESVADLIDAGTASAARAAARSLTGAFSREIESMVTALVDLRMLTEATLDFPEEELDFLRAADAANKLVAIRRQVQHVLARARQGALLRDGLTIVLVGEPNVGKSSLLNQLAGDDVAIVTPVPGTTRDAIASAIEIAGIPLTIVDTAGLRATDDPVERIGIERTRSRIAKADLALVIVDARDNDASRLQGGVEPLAALPDALPRIIVHNKIDLVAGASARVLRDAAGVTSVHLSAKSGAGVDALRDEIRAIAGAQEDMEGTYLARERHLVALREAESHLTAAAAHLGGVRPPLELFAEELREAQSALAAITGEFTADDLLGVIFSRFCIGK